LPRPSFPDQARPAVTHTLRNVDGHVEQETHAEDRVFQAVVDYAFGSGDRGKTLVGHDPKGQSYELRLSVYHEGAEPIWDVTSGHPPHPSNPSEYLGQKLSGEAVRRCFSCHVTNARATMEASGPEAADGAIGCERCHGPGGNHLLAVAAKFPDLAIARPSLASGARVVKVCAQCHSPMGRAVPMEDPTSVRFQATTLTWSRCYTESNDRLDCVTCHDPHRDASTSTEYYEARCLSCHSQEQRSEALKDQRQRDKLPDTLVQTTCPINPKTGCISCHMPTVKTIIPHSPFTDHFIRVHRDSATAHEKQNLSTH
jgi:hypothetical protein